MKKILYYLWKGIFIIISILILPIIWDYVVYNFKRNSSSISHTCLTSIFMLVIIGLVMILGYLFNKIIESFKPKNKKKHGKKESN
jgi:hypothetical protein